VDPDYVCGKGIGDVDWENEALLSVRELGRDRFSCDSIDQHLAEPPVAVVDKIRLGTGSGRGICEVFVFGRGQKIASKHYYRPRSAAAQTAAV
jgi:sulfate transport system substrate-binding protein